jgi:hypothetical protein
MSEMWQKKAVEAFEKLQVQRSPIFVEADVYSVLLVSLSIAQFDLLRFSKNHGVVSVSLGQNWKLTKYKQH